MWDFELLTFTCNRVHVFCSIATFTQVKDQNTFSTTSFFLFFIIDNLKVQHKERQSFNICNLHKV